MRLNSGESLSFLCFLVMCMSSAEFVEEPQFFLLEIMEMGSTGGLQAV